MPELEQEMEIGDGMQPKSLVMSQAEDMSSDYQDVDETQEIGTKYIRNLDQNKSFPIYANQKGARVVLEDWDGDVSRTPKQTTRTSKWCWIRRTF